MARRSIFIGTLALLLGLCATVAANAQSGCAAIYQGNVLTPAQWTLCFQQKNDALGYSPLNRSGDTMAGRLVTTAPGTSTSGLNLTPGTTPASPANGDAWVTSTDAYVRAGGVTHWLTYNPGRLVFVATAVNFNSSGDNAVALTMPPGFTRYAVENVRISGASHSLTTATVGVFTAASGGGVAIASTQAITVSATADATNNNMMKLTMNNVDTESYTLAGQPSLFVRVGTTEGAAATGNVTITVLPLP